MLLDGYTETTLELHWKATGWSTLKLHWNYTEMPLDGYTETTLHLQRTTNAPPAHHKCTSSAPQMHLQRTSTAPQLHLQRTPTAPPAHLKQCTSSAPQTAHLLAPQPHLHICTRTSSAPPSTTTFTNPCLAIISEVHLSAPQKCTPPRVRCAPPSTSAHRGVGPIQNAQLRSLSVSQALTNLILNLPQYPTRVVASLHDGWKIHRFFLSNME